jgi:hypothetical protein
LESLILQTGLIDNSSFLLPITDSIEALWIHRNCSQELLNGQ